jgi:hypothetical protein
MLSLPRDAALDAPMNTRSLVHASTGWLAGPIVSRLGNGERAEPDVVGRPYGPGVRDGGGA